MAEPQRNRQRRSALDARAELVAATVLELDEVGVERASLRGVARRVGMTHQSVAYHFADRTALLTEVAIGGFQDLAELIRSSLERREEDTDIGSAVATIGKSYVQFARDNRSRFELMFRSALLRVDEPRLRTAQAEVWELLRSGVADAVAKGWSADADPDQMAYAAWATVHGLATLEGNFASPPIAPDLVIELMDANVAAAGRARKAQER